MWNPLTKLIIYNMIKVILKFQMSIYMKSVLILPLLLLCTFCVYSQSSEFVNSDKLWSVLHENSADHIFPNDPYPFVKTTWYKMGSDTLIGDYNYKQLMISNDSLQMNWMTKGAIMFISIKKYPTFQSKSIPLSH
ncbi:hypothetical protein MASR2M47_41890 [Draconibacterium sp.]